MVAFEVKDKVTACCASTTLAAPMASESKLNHNSKLTAFGLDGERKAVKISEEFKARDQMQISSRYTIVPNPSLKRDDVCGRNVVDRLPTGTPFRYAVRFCEDEEKARAMWVQV